MLNQLKAAQEIPPNTLHISWHDSHWNVNRLTRDNVLDYFSELSNPFYDRQCNNQMIKMQRASPENLVNMQGIEYVVFYAQEPLFVIRKQLRYSPHNATPLANYYIIAGTVYQAPDLASVVNSRTLAAVHSLRSAFKEALSYSRYHPAKGYWWEFPGGEKSAEEVKKEKDTTWSQSKTTVFQRTRVDGLLADLVRRFPPPGVQADQTERKLTAEELKQFGDTSDTRSEVSGYSSAALVRSAPLSQLPASATSAALSASGPAGDGQPPMKRIKTEPVLVQSSQ